VLHGCRCWSPAPSALLTHIYYVQEHQGNDPSTQLVPSGTAGAGWSKPEEPQPAPQPQPEVRQSALTAGSNWASQGRQEGSSSYVPPVREGPYAPGSRGSFPVERHLNPEEYPSLAAGAKEKPPSKRHYEAASAQHQQVRSGDHDSVSHAAAALWLAGSTSLCCITLAGQLACCLSSLISSLNDVQLYHAWSAFHVQQQHSIVRLGSYVGQQGSVYAACSGTFKHRHVKSCSEAILTCRR
jgi:hypothetical protein